MIVLVMGVSGSGKSTFGGRLAEALGTDPSPAMRERHLTLLRGGTGLSPEQIEDMVDLAVSECERFYPAFQFVIWGGKSAADAVASSLLDTVGEA